MKHYFLKELVGNPVIVEGKAVEWPEIVNGGRGLLVTEDAKLAAALNKFADEGTGGVVRLSGEDEYNQKKTEANSAPLPRRKKESLRVYQRVNPFNNPQAPTMEPNGAEVVNAEPSAPTVPRTLGNPDPNDIPLTGEGSGFRPRTGKPGRPSVDRRTNAAKNQGALNNPPANNPEANAAAAAPVAGA